MVMDVQVRFAAASGMLAAPAYGLCTLLWTLTWAVSPQEAATKVGHKAESLPLWNEFAVLYTRHTAALAGLVATADVAEHLAEIATLCVRSSAPLSSYFTSLAAFDCTPLPGDPIPYILQFMHAANSITLRSAQSCHRQTCK